LLVVALICGKLALGSAMPLPMLPPSNCASQQDPMPDMSMPDMSMPAGPACDAAPAAASNIAESSAPARPAPCCKNGACALLQAPVLALAIPTLALRLQIAAQPRQPRLQIAAAPVSAPFRPPI
jgi:hypothetical protein